MNVPIPVAISSCLLGEAVRHDGAHKRQPAMLAALGTAVRWVPFCPEVMAGFGVPRPAVHLVGNPTGDRVIRGEDGADLTAALQAAAAAIVAQLGDVRGYIFKSRSPSCGLSDAVLRDAGGAEVGLRDGIVAAAVRTAYPQLPVATEVELATPDACADFLRRARA